MRKLILVFIAGLGFSGLLLAYPSFTGFSGAPASNGTCTSSCHAQNSIEPSCEVIGFPENYVPGQQYIITVRHVDGPSICQFNCSVRADEDSSVAGLLTAMLATEVYSTTNEESGVHWETSYADSGTFIWTAPQAQTGPVTLYWSGLQGTRAAGADQQISIPASEEFNSIDYLADSPEGFSLAQNYPNPFNQSTAINFEVSQSGDIVLEIANILGQRVHLVHITNARPGQYSIFWHGLSTNGLELPSGLYFYQLRTVEGNLTRKMTIIR